jgi:protein ERP2
LEAPNKKIVYKQTRAQFDSVRFVPEVSGVYVVCFSNEFSTFSHKLVYMDLQVGDEQPLPGLEQHVTVLTQVRGCIFSSRFSWNI